MAGLARTTRQDGHRSARTKATLTRPDGTTSRITIETVPLAKQSGRIPGVVIALLDITAQHLYEEQLLHIAYHDALTGLPNRALLWQRMKAAATNSLPYSIMLLDLNDFKEVNDTHGHDTGDELQLFEVRRKWGFG